MKNQLKSLINISKTFAIMLTVLLIVSCESDDKPQEMASIIGSWQPTRTIEVCSNGSESSTVLSSCVQTGRFTFSDNGGFNLLTYEEDNNNQCVVDVDINTTYTINNNILTGTLDDFPPLTIFKLTDTILQLGTNEDEDLGSGGTLCDGNNNVTSTFTEFVRVN